MVGNVSNDNGTRLIDRNIPQPAHKINNVRILENSQRNMGLKSNQIDASRGSNCLDVRGLIVADRDTDHFLVKMK